MKHEEGMNNLSPKQEENGQSDHIFLEGEYILL